MPNHKLICGEHNALGERGLVSIALEKVESVRKETRFRIIIGNIECPQSPERAQNRSDWVSSVKGAQVKFKLTFDTVLGKYSQALVRWK